MATVRFAKGKLPRGRVDQAKLRRTTEVDIQRYIREDGEGEITSFAGGRLVVPPEYVRRVRARAGLTQDEFARRFGLSVRTIQEWEQGRTQPEGPALTLLRVIEREPRAVARALAFRARPPRVRRAISRWSRAAARSRPRAAKRVPRDRIAAKLRRAARR